MTADYVTLLRGAILLMPKRFVIPTPIPPVISV